MPTSIPWPRVVAAVALAALVAVFGLLYLPAGLVAPLWAVAGLWVAWVVMAGLGLWWFRRRPWWVPGLPVLAVLVWAAVVSAGEALLGWTA